MFGVGITAWQEGDNMWIRHSPKPYSNPKVKVVGWRCEQCNIIFPKNTNRINAKGHFWMRELANWHRSQTT